MVGWIELVDKDDLPSGMYCGLPPYGSTDHPGAKWVYKHTLEAVKHRVREDGMALPELSARLEGTYMPVGTLWLDEPVIRGDTITIHLKYVPGDEGIARPGGMIGVNLAGDRGGEERDAHAPRLPISVSGRQRFKSVYIWGHMPAKLPPGRYTVNLQLGEYEWRDGRLVLAPKTRIRYFEWLTCTYIVPQPGASPASTPAKRSAATAPALTPADKGRARAAADIRAGRARILYYGKPWSQGKPLIDDQTGLPVEIASGCCVTAEFVAETDAYNAAMREWASRGPATRPTPATGPASQPASAPAYSQEEEWIRQALPRQWSLKTEVGGWGRRWIVERAKPIRVIHNSPLAPGPVEQTLGIVILPGPKVSQTDYERMAAHNAAVREKFRGKEATLRRIPPVLWWEQPRADQADWPWLLPTHSSRDASLWIDCRPLTGGPYEIPSKEDAAEAGRVLGNVVGPFAPQAEAGAKLRQPSFEEFRAALEASTDPVAMAVGFLRGRAAPGRNVLVDISSSDEMLAMDVLAGHWADPRSEAALAEIAASGRRGGGGIEYYPGDAWTRLVQVRARRGAQAVLAGADGAADVLARVRKAFADNPIDGPEANQRAALRARLAERAMELAGGGAADVVLLGGDRSTILDLARRNPAETVKQVRTIGAKQMLSGSRPGGLSLLVSVRPRGLQPLLEEWLAAETDKLRMRYLVLHLCTLGGRERTVQLLKSARREEYETAARHIESYPTAAELQDLCDELDRRRKGGAGPAELGLFEDAIRGGTRMLRAHEAATQRAPVPPGGESTTAPAGLPGSRPGDR
ncbi:MAG TPA: hypothetical protein PKG77_22690 [Phycisphaerae bacterium]|nr:hypothetical protein [Phycisphaerae bacterium]HQL73979.1 hypothetical protein [Phycisphaerae bacterium]